MTEDIPEITEVVRYRTIDDREFHTREAAECHLERRALIMQTDDILGSGGSIADCLRLLGWKSIDPVLEEVTKESKLSIPHWQCREEAGYSPSKFNLEGCVWVFGSAGSWSGPYGNWVGISDLVRYAKNSNSILKP